MTAIKRLYGEYLLVLLVLFIGICVSAWSAWQYQNKAEEKTVESFRAAAQDRIELISDKIEHNNVVLRSVSALFRASENVSREEFGVFTQQILKDYPYIHTLEWIPHVPQAERAALESNPSYPGFKMLQESGDGTLAPSEQRDEYFPVYYAEPFENGNKKIIGFDVSSHPERRKTLTRAMDERHLAVTGRVELLQASNPHTPGVIFYEPVYLKTGDGSGEKMAGFIGSVVPLADMLNAAIKPLSYTGVNIVIHDLSADDAKQKLLYVRPTRLKPIPDAEILEDYERQDRLVEKTVYEVGGRKWEIAVLPARGYFTADVTRPTYAILLGGLLFTVLLVTYMFSRVRETERINLEVAERTEQLSNAKREVEMILLSTNEGIAGLDRAGSVTFCNGMAAQLLGRRKDEIIGQHHHALFHAKHANGLAYDAADCPLQKTLDYGRACTVSDEVFWNKDGEAVQVEYTGSPIIQGGDVAGAVLVFRDISERRTLEKKLEQMARYDQLTGLANRGMFRDLLKAALARAGRAGHKVGVLYLDMNGFKQVNDTMGHGAGDELLKQFAERLKIVVRDNDTPARLGGDEFTILADSLADHAGCIKLVERLKESMKEPFTVEGKQLAVGASIGVAFYPDHAANDEELLTHADAAMYQAKKDKSLPYVIFAKGKNSRSAAPPLSPRQYNRD